MFSEKTETVCIVDENTEIVFLLECSNLVKLAERACHSINTFRNEKYSAAVGISLSTSLCKHFLAVFHIVVTIFVFASDMKTDTVKKTRVTFSIIDNDIVTCRKGVNCRNYSLISEIVKESILFLLELGEHSLEFLVISCIA